MAAKSGQILQTELLLIYGADPRAVDSQGNTPTICAEYLSYFIFNNINFIYLLTKN